MVRTLLIFVASALCACCDVECEKHQYAEMLIDKIESFKTDNGRLPKDVSELGLIELENSPAFYEKLSDTTYHVWYGLGIGQSNVYRSETKSWNKEG